jgi:phospholipase/carboxylesterase
VNGLHSRANGDSGVKAGWTGLREDGLPLRAGHRPQVSWTIPQEQRSDNAPRELQEKLLSRISTLAGVSTRQSAISVPGATGLMLGPAPAATPDGFLVPSVGEFAHQHPAHDGSLHVALPPVLPPVLAAEAVAKGWAVPHPLAGIRLASGMVLVYGPRDDSELETVAAIVQTSHHSAPLQV